MKFSTEKVKQIVKDAGAKKIVDLDNGGIAFKFRQHRIEIYERDGAVTFAYNSDPPEAACWEFATVKRLGDIQKFMADPDQLWGW